MYFPPLITHNSAFMFNKLSYWLSKYLFSYRALILEVLRNTVTSSPIGCRNIHPNNKHSYWVFFCNQRCYWLTNLAAQGVDGVDAIGWKSSLKHSPVFMTNYSSFSIQILLKKIILVPKNENIKIYFLIYCSRIFRWQVARTNFIFATQFNTNFLSAKCKECKKKRETISGMPLERRGGGNTTVLNFVHIPR